MPVNKKEQLIYTVLMVSFMVISMTFYNMVLHNGLSLDSLKMAWLAFPLTFSVAFLCEWLVVGRYGLPFAFNVMKNSKSKIKKQLFIPLIIVTGMAFFMSFYGTLLSNGLSEKFPLMWLKTFLLNFIFAYPLQILIARPLIILVFRSLFPVGTIVIKTHS